MQTVNGAVLVNRGWRLNEWLIAAGMGVYIIGVTIFAGTDAHTSARGRLIAGLVVLLGGMALLAGVPGDRKRLVRVVGLARDHHRPSLSGRRDDPRLATRSGGSPTLRSIDHRP
jgi:hypothetical protein